ncbi:aminoglycoside adenylyltransferase domain-containing protein [Nocardia altamirensis]|uniref:aminoglycoside adenylyltransferase domain-containing protein n=1 Tax=Nocardia altamirensis TaxID=472158 RepID=UPI000840721D|nr:aminoglycoside adenylyltransferase domain-containing protein [Nocardia altamirensis]
MHHADPPSLPEEVRPYLDELVQRSTAVCGPHLRSIFAVGSIALDDYRHGRSDIDVTMVVDPTLPAPAVHELAESLTHPTLPCPAAGLELVVYGSDFTASPSGNAGYLLNLNTGPMLPPCADFDSSGAQSFWYVIDRSIAYQSGRLLAGEPVRQVLTAPTQHDLFTALAASVREHSTAEGHLNDNRVLNGCRSAVFCRTGRWLPKRKAAQSIATSEAGFRSLVEAAVQSFERPRSAALPLPTAEVRTFLNWVAERVADAAKAA